MCAGSSPVTPTIEIIFMKQRISVRALIKQDGRILLVRRSSGRISILGKYELPGGDLQMHEQPEDALRRHLFESLTIHPETVQLFDTLSFDDPDYPGTQYLLVLYLVSCDSRVEPRVQYDKYIWTKLKDLQQHQPTDVTTAVLEAHQEKVFQSVSVLNNEDKLTTNTVIIYSDGGSRGNPGPSASAYVVMDVQENFIESGGAYLGITTNNQAEYQAVYIALKKALELGYRQVEFRSDSSLVINQMNSIYTVKNRDLWPIHDDIKELVVHFDKVVFTHVRREFNQIADGLVNKILDEHMRKNSNK